GPQLRCSRPLNAIRRATLHCAVWPNPISTSGQPRVPLPPPPELTTTWTTVHCLRSLLQHHDPRPLDACTACDRWTAASLAIDTAATFAQANRCTLVS